MQPKQTFSTAHAVILIMLASLAMQPAVVILPTISIISGIFHDSASFGEDLLCAYFLTLGLSSYLFGILIQRFGWLRSVVTGLALLILGNTASVLAIELHHATLFSLFRLLAGLGAGVCLPATYTYITDMLDATKRQRFYALMSLSLVIIPTIVLTIAGWLVTYVSLSSSVLLVSLICSVVLLTTLKLPHYESSPCTWRDCAHTLRLTTCNPALLLGSLMIALPFGAMWVFGTLMSVATAQVFHLTPYDYSLFNLVPVGGFLAGTVLSILFGSHCQPKATILQSLGLLGVVLGYHLLHSPDTLTYADYAGIGFLWYAAFAWLIPAVCTLALGNSEHSALASGTLSSIYTMLSAISLLLIGQSHTPPLALLLQHNLVLFILLTALSFPMFKVARQARNTSV